MNSYHYSSSAGIFGIINSCQLHCSNANFLNDPTEQNYFDSILKEVISKNSECKNIYEILYNNSVESQIINPFENYVISFCKNKDSLSMWSQYAKGNGYNLGFNIDSIIKRNINNFLSIKKVDLIYSKHDQISSLEKYILSHKVNSEKYLQSEKIKKIAQNNNDKTSYDIANNEQDNYLINFSSGLFEMKLKFKHEAFIREEEVRLVVSQDETTHVKTSHKISSIGIIVEYVSLELDLEEDLTSITIHPLNGNLHTMGMERFLNAKINIKNIDISKSKIPLRLI